MDGSTVHPPTLIHYCSELTYREGDKDTLDHHPISFENTDTNNNTVLDANPKSHDPDSIQFVEDTDPKDQTLPHSFH